MRSICEASLNKGILNTLYVLLTQRPCFGLFSPEMVETVAKTKSGLENRLFIDKGFVCSSQTGRNYAGTVRSRSCEVLARLKVRDTCDACEALKRELSINRSVLPNVESIDYDGEESSPGSQKSVWKVASSSPEEGCTFVCPQIQTFNMSLPSNCFSGVLQVTTIVEHSVAISSDLCAKVFLNEREVKVDLGEFERDKQVGPLLEKVASLRACVGYPDADLVAEAEFIAANTEALSAEAKKVFQHAVVDGKFVVKKNADQKIKGTVRAASCRTVAGNHSDICDQCRLLQEPIDFLRH